MLAQGARLELLANSTGQKLRLATGQETLLELQVTMQADDGMSDNPYPMEGKYGSDTGGCYTDKFPPFNPYEMLEGLGSSPELYSRASLLPPRSRAGLPRAVRAKRAASPFRLPAGRAG